MIFVEALKKDPDLHTTISTIRGTILTRIAPENRRDVLITSRGENKRPLLIVTRYGDVEEIQPRPLKVEVWETLGAGIIRDLEALRTRDRAMQGGMRDRLHFAALGA